MKNVKGWQDCSIDLFYKLDKIISNQDQSITLMDKNVQLISVIFDIPVEDVYKMDITEYNKYITQMQWVKDIALNKNFKPSTIIIDDVKYEVTPIKKLTIAQYIDFQTFWQFKDLEKYIGNILASFIVPKGKQYAEGYDPAELALTLRNSLDILTAQNLIFFFLKKYLRSIQDSFSYLKKQMKSHKEKQQVQEAFKLVLDGLRL